MRAFVILALAGAATAGCGQSDERDAAVPPADAAVAEDLSVADDPEDSGPPDDLTPVVGPARLADTGLYADFATRTLAPGVIHYVPRYELWSDGAAKERYLLLPPNQKIDTSDMDNWVFPVGTRVWKEFRIDGRLIETRLLEKIYPNPGGWWEVAYLWSGDGSDAVAVKGGAPDAGGTSHDVPSQEECAKCHSNVSDVLIGVSAIQLSGANGKGPLSDLVAAGLLSSPPPAEFAVPGTGVVQDALGYLHANCGHCHNRSGIFQHAVPLYLRLHVADLAPADTDTYRSSIGAKTVHAYPPGVRIAVAPGDPAHSQLYARMGVRDDYKMPPACSKVVDTAGMKTIFDWITGLPH